MTKAALRQQITDIMTRHPVHALPLLAQVVAALVERLPEDRSEPKGREHVHKRFVPIDVVIPGKDDHL